MPTCIHESNTKQRFCLTGGITKKILLLYIMHVRIFLKVKKKLNDLQKINS